MPMEIQPTNPSERTQLIPPPTVGPPPPPRAPAIVAPGDIFADDKRLLDLFKDLKKEAYDQRTVFERGWWRNVLYIMSRQWIFYDQKRGMWVDKRLAKWIPRPVTNVILDTHQTIHSVFQQVNLQVKARPIGNAPENVQTAETADAIEPCLAEEHQMRSIMREHDFWLIATGNAFLRPWWDKRSGTGAFTVPYEQCLDCGVSSLPQQIIDAGHVCPQCMSPSLELQIDETTGRPVMEAYANGHGATDILSPFEVAVPGSYKELEESPYAITQRWRTKLWATANLPEEMLKGMVFEKLPHERSLQLMKALAGQSDIGSAPLSLEGSGEGDAEGFVEYELMMRPSKDFPDGALIRVMGDGGAERVIRWPDESLPGPLPYQTKDGRRLFNLIHTCYWPIGGRFWGLGPLDPCIQKQDQINQLDSLIQLTIQRVANPVWLEPKGAEVKKFTGEPGLVVRYNPLIVGGAKPEKIEGSQIPMTVMQVRAQLFEDVERLAGTHDVIKGSKPSGVEAFSALQLLVERSQARFSIPLGERGDAYKTWFSMALELERQFGPDERTWSLLGPNNVWTYTQFQKAKLLGAVEILIEDGSTMPKTSLGKRAAIEQLRQMNALDFANPDIQYSVLRAYGQTDLIPSLDVHVKASLQEQDAFERWAATGGAAPQPQMQVDPMTGAEVMGFAAPVIPGFAVKPWHNPAIHLAEHDKWLNSDRIRQLLLESPYLEMPLILHRQEHEMVIQAQQMAEAAMAAGPQPGGGGRALANSNQESDNPKDQPSGTGQRADNRGPE